MAAWTNSLKYESFGKQAQNANARSAPVQESLQTKIAAASADSDIAHDSASGLPLPNATMTDDAISAHRSMRDQIHEAAINSPATALASTSPPQAAASSALETKFGAALERDLAPHSLYDAAQPLQAAQGPAPVAADVLARVIDGLVSGLQKFSSVMPKTKDTIAGLALSLEGEADALGTDTRADGDVFARVIDKGAVSVAYGRAAFSARAESGEGGIAFASASSDAFVGGADFIIELSYQGSVMLQSSESQFALDTSITYVFAVDFESWDLRSGPIVLDIDRDRSLIAELDELSDLIASGNIATFEVDVQAIGKTTFTEVIASVLTVEDQLSSVAAITNLAIT